MSGADREPDEQPLIFQTEQQLKDLDLWAKSGATIPQIERLKKARMGDEDSFKRDSLAAFNTFIGTVNKTRAEISSALELRKKQPGRSATILTQEGSKTVLGGV